MPRIFIGLASLNALMLLASFAIGFLSEGRAHVSPDVPLTAAQRMFTLHLFGGLIAALVALLVHCLTFTYFMGTGRWVQEVVVAYGLPDSLWTRARRLKQQTLPLALGSILLVIGTAMLGAASDVGMIDKTYHLVLATVAIGFNLWSHMGEYQTVSANAALLDQIMAEVTRMQKERSLADCEVRTAD